METLYIVMPAYNEEENIVSVVEQWYEILDGKSSDSRLVIADSGSVDLTHDILINLKEKYPKLVLLSNTGKQHGPKVIALYNYAIEHNADFIFQTDSDGQTNPGEFSVFWEQRTSYDAIIGNRVKRGDGKGRAFVERVVCLLLKMYYGVKVPDANAPYRLMRTAMVKRYITKLPVDYNLPNIIMTAFFLKNDEKICFKEISFLPRQAGLNSINLLKIFKIGLRALVDFKYFKSLM